MYEKILHALYENWGGKNPPHYTTSADIEKSEFVNQRRPPFLPVPPDLPGLDLV